MSESAGEDVEVTADGLIELRTQSPLARRLGIDASLDRLFVTEAGRRLALMASALDPVYEPYNLVRYKWFGERLVEWASYHQILVLGVGYDTRALAFPADAHRRVFEIDRPRVLASKRRVLAAHGINVPSELSFVAADLSVDPLPQALARSGFDRQVTSAVLAEGVTFFLPATAVLEIIDPSRLGLASGSVAAFDLWTADRIRSLNAKLVERTGKPLFGDTPFGNSADEIGAGLRAVGYAQVSVRSIGALLRDYGVEAAEDPLGESWFIVTARVP